MTAPLEVLLAEPDAPVRAGIRMALEADGLEVCAEPLDASSAVDAAMSRRPSLCLIDEARPGGALVAVDAIFAACPEIKHILLTETEEPDSLLAAVRAGAVGFLRKDLDPARFPETVRGVIAGEAALSRRLTGLLAESYRARERGRTAPTLPGGPSLTDRELEVLELMIEGLRTSEIAERLRISEVTVRRHVSSSMTKLGVDNRAAAIDVLTGRSHP
jgi:DNA-binding NarL/FixJ family response regulator